METAVPPGDPFRMTTELQALCSNILAFLHPYCALFESVGRPYRRRHCMTGTNCSVTELSTFNPLRYHISKELQHLVKENQNLFSPWSYENETGR
jgi:hypothetical protein